MAPLERSFKPELASVRKARQFIAECLRHDEHCDAALQIVSELASNAVVHAQSPFEVAIDHGPPIRIEVRDRIDVMPFKHPAAPGLLRGRGLLLIEAFSRRWGSEKRPDGKVVWVEL